MQVQRGRMLRVLAVALVAGTAGRAVADGEARALLDQVRQLNQTTRAWNDRTQRLQLTITDRRKNQYHRELEILTKKYGPKASRSILFFVSPPEVRGIGFLQWIDPEQEDRQWLFLPELKRVRQITGTSKRESFVGTDFSYEDLALMNEMLDWTEDEARTALLRDERIDDHACAIIELVPTDRDIGYGKIRLWLSRDDLVPRKFEFDNRDGQLAKTLLASDYRPVGPIPAAHYLEMRNERSRSATAVRFTEIKYNAGLSEETFSQRRLERGM